MLPSQVQKQEISPITSKLQYNYKAFKFISQTDYYKVFIAESKDSGTTHTVRILDINSEFYKKYPEQAASMFIKELLHLCCLLPESISIQDFEVSGKTMVFVTTSSLPLDYLLKEGIKTSITLDTEKLIRDVLGEANFLINEMKIHNESTISLDFKNIYLHQTSKKEKFILGNWMAGISEAQLKELSEYQPENNKDLAGKQIYSFASHILEIFGLESGEIVIINQTKNPKAHQAALESILEQINQPDQVKNLLNDMLAKGSQLKLVFQEISHLGKCFGEEYPITTSKSSGNLISYYQRFQSHMNHDFEGPVQESYIPPIYKPLKSIKYGYLDLKSTKSYSKNDAEI